jgi:hypothetical protein
MPIVTPFVRIEICGHKHRFTRFGLEKPADPEGIGYLNTDKTKIKKIP